MFICLNMFYIYLVAMDPVVLPTEALSFDSKHFFTAVMLYKKI
jgi:hypothetical protein